MIPLRLELKNFLPYCTPDPVRFEGIHLACLTGSNGAGKSSLLDAITWVLWGSARTRRDDELIHMGQNSMEVQLHFEQEGEVYVVRRQRARGKRSQSALYLHIQADDHSLTNITEPSIRATQNRINHILRMDYDTFTNSAYLQQGKADAFTMQTPGERKRILANILGLDRWERYETAVKEKLRSIDAELNVTEFTIRDIDSQLERRPALEAALRDAEAAYTAAEEAQRVAEELRDAFASAPADLRRARDQQRDLTTRLDNLRRELDAVQLRIQHKAQDVEQLQEIIAERAEIEAGYASFQAARAADRDLGDRLRSLTGLNDRRAELQNALNIARTRLESSAGDLRRRIAGLEQQTAVDHRAELDGKRAEVVALEALEAEREQLQQTESNHRAETMRLHERRKTLTDEGKALRDRMQRLENTGDEAANCPLCGQPLSADHLARLTAQLNEEIDAKRAIYAANEQALSDLREQLQASRQRLDEIEPELRLLPPLRELVGRLEAQASQTEAAAVELDDCRQQLAAVENELNAETYAAELRADLAALDAERAALGYDDDAHQDARDRLNTYQAYEQRQRQLELALERLPDVQEQLDDASARRDQLTEDIEQAEASQTALASDIESLTARVDEFQKREAEASRLRTEAGKAREALGTVRQELNALDNLVTRKQTQEQRREHLRHQQALYAQLKLAFGKNGVPAMIIESAIPELETTANRLLSRMTDGRMHLRLTTQREKVTGGQAETLDIEIADELGTRNYDLYSGGEAFRINFALRVALSQMLARRAGAQLRTLFVDEGFGTQDDAGRAKLVEAINAIQHEFKMILVITHIDDLRDSFPVHIIVEKTPNGSRINVT